MGGGGNGGSDKMSVSYLVVCGKVLVTLPIRSCCLCQGSGHTACHILLFVLKFWSHCLSDPVVCVKVLITLPIRSCCLC